MIRKRRDGTDRQLMQCVRRTELPVNLSTMSDLENGDGAIVVSDLVNNPVDALSHPVQVVTAEFFGAHRPRLRSEFPHA